MQTKIKQQKKTNGAQLQNVNQLYLVRFCVEMVLCLLNETVHANVY